MTSAAGRVLIKNGRVLTLDSRIGDFDRADVLINGPKIVEVRPEIEAPDAEVVDATDMVVIPGLIDTHRHVWQGAVRNLGADMTISNYFVQLFPRIGPRYRPQDAYIGNLLGALEALSAGITCVFDWCHIVNSPAHADAALKGLEDSGLRAVFAYGVPLGLGVEAWYGDSKLTHPEDARRMRREHFSSDDRLVTFALGMRGPDLSTIDVTTRDFNFARDLEAPISIHLGANGYGWKRSVARLKDAGLLGPHINYVHVTETSAEELRMIADSGGTVSITPVAEMVLGVGVPATGRLLANGVRPGLGVDTITGSGGDLFSQMRTALGMERMVEAQAEWNRGNAYTAAKLTARQVLEFATREGARSIWLDSKIGTLTPGKEADIVLLRADDLNMCPVNNANDAALSIVLSAEPGNVDTVFVAGKAVKRGGQLLGFDLVRIRDQACKSRAHLWNLS